MPEEHPDPDRGEPLTEAESDDHLDRIDTITSGDDVQTDPLTIEQEAELRAWAEANGYPLAGSGQTSDGSPDPDLTREQAYCLNGGVKVKVACAVIAAVAQRTGQVSDAVAVANGLINGDGGTANAVHHCYWMGQSTFLLEKAPFVDAAEAAGLVYAFGLEHELSTEPNMVVQSTMDIHNNGFGASYGASAASTEDVVQRCSRGALEGPLVQNQFTGRFPNEPEPREQRPVQPGRLLGRVGYTEKAINLKSYGGRGSWAPLTVWKATAGTYGPIWDKAYEKDFRYTSKDQPRYPDNADVWGDTPLLARLEWDPDQSGVWRPTGLWQWTPTGIFRLILNAATGTTTYEGIVAHTSLFLQDTRGICAPTTICVHGADRTDWASGRAAYWLHGSVHTIRTSRSCRPPPTSCPTTRTTTQTCSCAIASGEPPNGCPSHPPGLNSEDGPAYPPAVGSTCPCRRRFRQTGAMSHSSPTRPTSPNRGRSRRVSSSVIRRRDTLIAWTSPPTATSP